MRGERRICEFVNCLLDVKQEYFQDMKEIQVTTSNFLQLQIHVGFSRYEDEKSIFILKDLKLITLAINFLYLVSTHLQLLIFYA
jgi:hypothetical protein